MTMTIIYICAGLGVIALCAVSYALGWCEGKRQGRLDCCAEAGQQTSAGGGARNER